MLIAAIRLLDFQVHEDLELKFSPTITTIKGPTDRGKSSVLRALRWVCLNDLSGEEFIRDGAKRTEISITIQLDKKEREIIRRAKGNRENLYACGSQEFFSFGTGVPAPVAALLRVSEINFQAQHDSPFWFAETAGEVSRRLNSVIDLSIIDTSLSNIASQLRRAQERVTLCTERLQDVETKFSQIEWQRLRVAQFQALKEKWEKTSTAHQKHLKLTMILATISSNTAKECEDRFQALSGCFSQAGSLIKLQRKEVALSVLIESIADELKIKMPPDFSTIEQLEEALRKQRDDQQRLFVLIRQIENATLAVEAKRVDFESIETKFHKQTKGTKCPFCGSTI